MALPRSTLQGNLVNEIYSASFRHGRTCSGHPRFDCLGDKPKNVDTRIKSAHDR